MTVTLAPDLENELREQAARRGQNPDDYLSELVAGGVRESVPPIIRSPATPEAFVRSWRERAARRPLLASPDEDVFAPAFQREDIYGDEKPNMTDTGASAAEPKSLVQSSPEWKVLLRSLGRPCGISLSIEATSRENLYGDDMR